MICWGSYSTLDARYWWNGEHGSATGFAWISSEHLWHPVLCLMDGPTLCHMFGQLGFGSIAAPLSWLLCLR